MGTFRAAGLSEQNKTTRRTRGRRTTRLKIERSQLLTHHYYHQYTMTSLDPSILNKVEHRDESIQIFGGQYYIGTLAPQLEDHALMMFDTSRVPNLKFLAQLIDIHRNIWRSYYVCVF